MGWFSFPRPVSRQPGGLVFSPFVNLTHIPPESIQPVGSVLMPETFGSVVIICVRENYSKDATVFGSLVEDASSVCTTACMNKSL